ncbi:mitochondrial 37S ribosomal protein uS11m [Aspergillus ibericus CBS 121593]|uniref:Small ribosomal subunit protein uS11m n=1 Tax=Aspergillus ibericus CBS 121593 TaxID=1448316 RepID=A0A395GXP4_9EURO|nr:translational machinery component [Aspergillus ibericus CBS 121593]RAL00351.1 translational machinery component [Aspergillus ibericus CBS 121593]
MNSNFVTALTRALPNVGRSCQLRAPAFRLTRPFSSTPMILESGKEKTRQIERQILNTPAEQQPASENASISAITKMMQGDKARPAQGLSRDYSRMAESLEAEMIRQPYADRSPPYHLHVYCHKHNTLLTLTRPNGDPMMALSCGHLGFRKGKRAGYEPAHQLTAHVFAQIQERGLLMEIKRLEIIFRDFGPGREAFTKVLLGNEGKNIRGLVCRVTDATRLKFGGSRSPRVRRLG